MSNIFNRGILMFDQIEPTRRLLRPYVLLRPSEKGLRVIPIQYDSDSTVGKQHSIFTLDYWMSSPTIMTRDDLDILVYLVKAEKCGCPCHREEIKFGTGKLWGWFPDL